MSAFISSPPHDRRHQKDCADLAVIDCEACDWPIHVPRRSPKPAKAETPAETRVLRCILKDRPLARSVVVHIHSKQYVQEATSFRESPLRNRRILWYSAMSYICLSLWPAYLRLCTKPYRLTTAHVAKAMAKLISTMPTAACLTPSELTSLLPLPQHELGSYVTLFALAATANVEPLKFPLL
jgi:hypothetical protein